LTAVLTTKRLDQGLTRGGHTPQGAKKWHGEHRKRHRDHRLRTGGRRHGLGGDGGGDDDESKFPAGGQHERGLGGDLRGQARDTTSEPLDAKLDENDAKRQTKTL
jgi:hypothetical protein